MVFFFQRNHYRQMHKIAAKAVPRFPDLGKAKKRRFRAENGLLSRKVLFVEVKIWLSCTRWAHRIRWSVTPTQQVDALPIRSCHVARAAVPNSGFHELTLWFCRLHPVHRGFFISRFCGFVWVGALVIKYIWLCASLQLYLIQWWCVTEISNWKISFAPRKNWEQSIQFCSAGSIHPTLLNSVLGQLMKVRLHFILHYILSSVWFTCCTRAQGARSFRVSFTCLAAGRSLCPRLVFFRWSPFIPTGIW